jgi:hypothetical protein
LRHAAMTLIDRDEPEVTASSSPGDNGREPARTCERARSESAPGPLLALLAAFPDQLACLQAGNSVTMKNTYEKHTESYSTRHGACNTVSTGRNQSGYRVMHE